VIQAMKKASGWDDLNQPLAAYLPRFSMLNGKSLPIFWINTVS
jgi:hypothetical protein